MSIFEKLYDFQQRIVEKFKSRDAFGLFLDMGLGKTPTSLAFAEQNSCTKVLIISINSKAVELQSVSGSWLDWASKSSIPYTMFAKSSVLDFDKNRPELFIINYESLFSRKKDRTKRVELRDEIRRFILSCAGHNVAIIVDESHKMKNLQSKQTLAINAIKRELMFRATHVYTYLLTGTPFTTGYIDLYSQLKTLGYPETKTSFVDQFCERGHVPGLLGWQQPIVGYKNVDRLFDVIHEYAITIKSEEVVNLPDKIFVDHVLPRSKYMDLFTYEKLKGNEIVKELASRHAQISVDNVDAKRNNPFYRNIAYPELTWLAETTGTFHMRARQLSIGFQGNSSESKWYDKTRLESLRSFLQDHEDNYVLFYNFTPELLELYDVCTDLGYNVDVYCGEVKSLTFYDKFAEQSDAERLINKKNIILSNFASGSTGMNWQLYDKCIIFSIPVYAHYEQALKRIHRLGQKSKTVVYHVFYQDNWLDKSMLHSLKVGTNYNEEMFEADLERVQSLL